MEKPGREFSMDVRSYRKIHRYLGRFVGVQLLLWTAGGLFFSLTSPRLRRLFNRP